MRVVVIQRVIPHYRKPIFRSAYEDLGWMIATGSNAQSFGLNLIDEDEPWLIRIPIRRSERRQYAAMVDLAPILETRPEAIVAEFSLQMSSTWQLALNARRKRGPRLAFWSQGSNVERGFRSPGDILSQVTRLALMRSADAQLCYSQDGADYLRRHMPSRQGIFVAPNTLDVATLQASAEDLSPAQGLDANLLLIGRMTEDKRMDLAVKAVAALRDEMPGITLTIIGDGPEMENIRKAAIPFGEAAHFLGAVYDEDRLADIYRGASLTLISGAAGLNVNQSLGYGVPVMLFDDARSMRHHPEHAYVEDGVNGYRIAPASTEEMTTRLRSALSGASPRRLLASGIARTVEEKLSLDRMLAGMRDLDRHFRTLPARR